MENIEKTLIKERKILRRDDIVSTWTDIITEQCYSKYDLMDLLNNGWQIIDFQDSFGVSGSGYTKYGRFTILIEKN